MGKQQGFNLIELIVVLAIGAVLLTLAAPSMTDFIQNNRVRALTNDFVVALNVARTEAVKRGTTVSVCPSVDNAGTTCRGNADWTNGWIVFVDSNADGVMASAADRILVKQPPPAGSTITTATNRITFSDIGFVQTGAGNYALRAQGCSGNHGRTVSLSATGHLAQSATACY